MRIVDVLWMQRELEAVRNQPVQGRNVAILNITSEVKTICSRVYGGMRDKTFYEARACIAEEDEQGGLTGIAFGEDIGIGGIADGKICEPDIFTNSIKDALETAELKAARPANKVICYISGGLDVRKVVENTLLQLGVKPSEIGFVKSRVQIML